MSNNKRVLRLTRQQTEYIASELLAMEGGDILTIECVSTYDTQAGGYLRELHISYRKKAENSRSATYPRNSRRKVSKAKPWYNRYW